MNQTELFNLISDYVYSHFQMTLATYGEHPWIAALYYSVDKDLNIYFLSDPQTIHCQQLSQNGEVAVSVADAPQTPTAKKLGLQIYGTAEQIAGKTKITHAITLWKKTVGVTSDVYSYAGMMNKAIKGRMYKVTPHKIKFFNEALWEEGSEPMFELPLS